MVSDAIPEQHFQKVLDEVARRNGFKKPRFEVHPGSGSGDNYFSIMYRVAISEAAENSSKETLRLMCKGILQASETREAFELNNVFRNESTFYQLLSAYGELMQEKGLLVQQNDEDFLYPEAPRCFLTSVGGPATADIVVLQDMSAEGYSMRSRLEGLDALHTGAVLGALARLHSSSFALESLQPHRFNSLRENIYEVYKDLDCFRSSFFRSDLISKTVLGMDNIPYAIQEEEKSIIERFPEGSSEYIKAQKYCASSKEELHRLYAPRTDGGNAICHGDCWINNIMFKDNAEGRPPSVCFLDFQTGGYGSPVLDLMYFLSTSTEKDMRDAHLDALLRCYHEELRSRMLALGVSDPDALYSWQRFQAHLREYMRFGLVYAAVVLPFFMSQSPEEELPDWDAELRKGPGEARNMYEVRLKDTRALDRRLSDWLEDMVQRGLSLRPRKGSPLCSSAHSGLGVRNRCAKLLNTFLDTTWAYLHQKKLVAPFSDDA